MPYKGRQHRFLHIHSFLLSGTKQVFPLDQLGVKDHCHSWTLRVPQRRWQTGDKITKYIINLNDNLKQKTKRWWLSFRFTEFVVRQSAITTTKMTIIFTVPFRRCQSIRSPEFLTGHRTFIRGYTTCKRNRPIPRQQVMIMKMIP